MKLKLARPIAFFDLESTGTSFQKDRIVEIYIKKLLPSGAIEEYHTLVNPKIPIPPEATAIHGISDTDVQDKPSFLKIAFELNDFLKDCDLAGFNSNRYDIPLLQEEFYRVGIVFDMENRHCVDAFKVFQKKEKRDLAAAYLFYCNKILINAHSATADVDATMEVLLAQLERYPDLESTVPALHEFSKDAEYVDSAMRLVRDGNVIRFNFGKHKGRIVEEVLREEPQYFDWVQRSDFAFDTKHKLKAIRDNMLKGGGK